MTAVKCSTFYLSTLVASSSTNGNTITFSNFNIYQLLGDLYHQYDQFKIVLNSYSNYNASTVANTCVAIKMSGLSFDYCFDYGTNLSTMATLGMVNVASAGVQLTQLQANFGTVFSKPPPSVNLIIYLYDVKTNTIVSSTNYGSSFFSFTIYGIK